MSMTEKQIPWYFTPAVVIVAGCRVAMVNFGARSIAGCFALADAKIAEYMGP